MACCPDGYAELGVTTNFSFLRGASHPGDMVCEAHNLGLDAIGIADRNTFSGIAMKIWPSAAATISARSM